MGIPAWLRSDPRVVTVHSVAATSGTQVPFPSWVTTAQRGRLAGLGITSLWGHQAVAGEALFDGRHVALATPTASGKSLGYLLPILSATADARVGFAVNPSRPSLVPHRRPHTALYLAPTKALAHDQLRSALQVGGPDWKVCTLDGDSDQTERRFARDFAAYVLTNPDMLHRAVLPNHQRWAQFLSTLRYVVIDEAHRYRGLFGAHVAQVLRRLRRLSHHHGADPVFVAASGTVAEPSELLSKLTGVTDVVEVSADASARPGLDWLFWHPEDDPHREAADLLARFVDEGMQTLCFTSSRVQAELVADRARRRATSTDAIATYRAGYLADDRRVLERDLREGRLRGVASTSALELGVDIAGMDAVISCGFPGTISALWQQVGRAGRASRSALAVLVARPDPLDAYLTSHPELIVDSPVEATVLHPDNPFVLSAHLAAAAQELPITHDDATWFGNTTEAICERLATRGVLRRRSAGWYWTHPERAVDAIDLRGATSQSVAIVDSTTGRVVGQVDPSAADRTVHPGAVYLHQGDQWLVEDYDPSSLTALCHRQGAGYFTQAQGASDLRILTNEKFQRLGKGEVHLGAVEFSSQVTSYLRRDEVTGKVWDSTPLDLPIRTFQTRAVWWTLDEVATAVSGVEARDLPGAAHAAEHASIGLLPAFAPCDRWDIGGLSTTLHPDTGSLTVFVHDGLPGGAGFADRGFDLIRSWLTATLERVSDCACDLGCPRCIVSPKCGNGNSPLDKRGGASLLRLLVG